MTITSYHKINKEKKEEVESDARTGTTRTFLPQERKLLPHERKWQEENDGSSVSVKSLSRLA
jgi:hypothetical protein